MAQQNNNTSGKKFQHLSDTERGQIEAYAREGHGVTAIARKIGRDKGTVSRELRRGAAVQRKRNKYESRDPKSPEFIEKKEYFAETGAAVYKKNRANSKKPHKIAEAAEFVAYADKMILQNKWSPDAICGRAAVSGEWEGKAILSAKTIYNYIDKGLMKAKNLDLWEKAGRKPRSKRGLAKKNIRILGESIEKRPEEVDAREVAGHWEIDSVIGRKTDKRAVMTVVERKTRFQIARKLESRESAAVDAEFARIYASFGESAAEAMKSATADNGSEFSGLAAAAKCPVYFCHPYSSWEKGSNERHNGLLRRFIKKGESVDSMSVEMISRAGGRNNNLPRKILGYRTPFEAFADEFGGMVAGLFEANVG